ncbi:MAG: hypothetical protein IT383_04875 [Deltaproteobacteria bacterium]|nr:hypothetical protein [Deltaproteobacteria bacterium]
MKNLTKILLSCGVALATLPMAAAGCFDFPTECETDADCVEPETCNTTIGVCEGAEGEGEGEGEGEVACDGGDIDDGACLEDRDTDVLADPYTCDGSVCVDPNELTANCAGAQAANADYEGGPVILSIDEVDSGGDGETCPSSGANGGYNSYIALVYSETAFDNGLNANHLHFIDPDGDIGGTYSDSTILPAVAAEPSIGAGYYIVDFYLCGDGANGAIHLTNNDGDGGNSFCMSMAN